MENHLTVLYISYDGMTDSLGQSQVLPYLSRLVSKGHQIHLMSCEKSENYQLNRKRIAQLIQDSGIVWHPVSYTKSPPVLSTVWDVFKMKKRARELHHEHDFDIVHCRSYVTAIVGLFLKQKFGVKFLFDIRGFWVDERVDGGLWNLSNPLFKLIYNYYKRKEALFFAKADAVVTLTNASKEYIRKTFEFTNNITVIPCAADLKLFRPQNLSTRNQYRKKLNVEESFVLLYLGSVGTWYLLEEMLDFFLVLKQHKENAKFLFLTGDDPNIILNTALQKGINVQDVIVKKSVRAEVPAWLAATDLSVFFIKECFSKMASSPTKHGELLAANVPVVCNDIGDLKEIISYKNSGILVKGFHQKSYQQAIEQVFLLQNDQQASSDTANEFYALEKGVEKYHAIYESLS